MTLSSFLPLCILLSLLGSRESDANAHAQALWSSSICSLKTYLYSNISAHQVSRISRDRDRDSRQVMGYVSSSTLLTAIPLCYTLSALISVLLDITTWFSNPNVVNLEIWQSVTAKVTFRKILLSSH